MRKISFTRRDFLKSAGVAMTMLAIGDIPTETGKLFEDAIIVPVLPAME